MNKSRDLIQKGVNKIYSQEKKDNKERELIIGKVKSIIEKFGAATSEGKIFWENETVLYDNKLERYITI